MHDRSVASTEDEQPDMRKEPTCIAAVQADAEDFGTLYERYVVRIYRYLRARTSTEEDAADLTQQVFLRALDAFPAYRAQGVPFAAWLFRIARNAVTDAYRRHHNTFPWDGLPEALQPTDTAGPEAALLHKESLQQMGRLLMRLDTGKREMLALRFAGGLTAREIALVIGKSEAAVKKQLSRTMHDLKEQYHAE